jgi:hypothetical protein
MTLHQKQVVFAGLLAQLIQEAFRQGFDITIGECYRTPEQAQWNAEHGKGIVNSVHCKRLAVDINLFKSGRYLTNTEDYTELGIWWEALSKSDFKCCWGGRFKNKKGDPTPDGNHFSIEHEGVK